MRDSVFADTVEVRYRVLPTYYGTEYRYKSLELIGTEYAQTFRPYKLGSEDNSTSIFQDEGLQKSGTISRGIQFGNQQNLSVNSALNLQLNGKISDRFHLMASITDDNIPIQPDGNTQALQDFDQVYIRVYDDRTQLIGGDFQLKKPHGYFMNYHKRNQGGYVETRFDLPSSPWQMRVEASASISKGKFARNTLQGIEGNQGPYRLTGADNELYIMVLAGTEQVYIDGRLLQRGQDKDYTIDYNAAEISFTPKQFITKDRRIVVEFQYSERRYARPLIHTSMVAESAHSKVYVNVYSENDAKNQPLQQDLTDHERAILHAAGDDLLMAFTSGIDSVSYNNNYVLYAMRDSLSFDSIFVFTTDSTVAHYRLSFTLVGSGNGDYVEDGFTANGKKYKWVAPVFVNGQWVRQGNYAPLRLLTPPKKNQMVTTGYERKWGVQGNSQVQVEGAMSYSDLNTFSSLGNEDNTGYALRAIYRWKQSQFTTDTLSGNSGQNKKAKTYFNTTWMYEFTDKNFAPIERYRDVEFTRNWNVNSVTVPENQHLSSVELGMERKKLGSIKLGGDLYILGEEYQGYKGRWLSQIKTPGNFTSQVNASYLMVQGALPSEFLRHQSNTSQQLGRFRVYFKDEHEYNMRYQQTRDSLNQASYQFYDWEVGVGTADTTQKTVTLYYRDRLDKRADGNRLESMVRAEQYGIMTTFMGKKRSRISVNVSNRKLRVLNPELYTQQPENTLLARTEYSFQIKDGFLSNTIFYEIGSGLEQRREFIYLEVPAGQGIYVWNDYNQDGVKDLNEFEVAQFGYEANYIRSFIQSNNYARTYTNQFVNSLVITPARLWNSDSGWRHVISKFSAQSNLRLERKTTREEPEDRFNPFETPIADTSLMLLNRLFRNSVFFNKSNPVVGCDYTYQSAGNKNLMSNGFETRSDNYHQIGGRWSFYRTLTLFLEHQLGEKVVSSDYLNGRNYAIHYFSLSPRLSWQRNHVSRFQLIAQYSEKNNVIGTENAILQKLGTELVVNSMEKGSFQMEVIYHRIRYNGGSNNSLSFDMLEGLSGGNNFTWSANWQRTIAKNLQLNLNYNGRKPEGTKTIHAGGVQLRALF